MIVDVPRVPEVARMSEPAPTIVAPVKLLAATVRVSEPLLTRTPVALAPVMVPPRVRAPGPVLTTSLRVPPPGVQLMLPLPVLSAMLIEPPRV